VVAQHDEDLDPRPLQASHRGAEEQAGGKGVPFPVVEIAGDHHEGDLFLDCLGH
jgi:hypothetical protein